MLDEPAGARCATHPDVAAVRACARCGDYACQACLDPSYPDRCARCAARLPHGIAWEDPRAGGWVARFLRTVRDVVGEPRVAFPGPARSGPALGFAALCALIWGITGAALSAALLWELLEGMLVATMPEASPGARWALIGSALCIAAIAMVPLTLAWVGLQAGAFTAGLHLVGRRVGAHRVALRACGYAQAVYLVVAMAQNAGSAAAGWLEAPDIVTVLSFVGGLLWTVGTARVCLAAGNGVGLTPGRATLATIPPTLLTGMVSAYFSFVAIRA